MDEEVVPVLYVEDADRAVAWYQRLGFVKEWEHRFEPGFPWFVSVARGDVRLYLSEHRGDARPDTLIHLYAVTWTAWRRSSAASSTKKGSPDARRPSSIRTAIACALPPVVPDSLRLPA